MKTGFGQASLIPAIDWPATTGSRSEDGKPTDYDREQKFDITDRVVNMWRPEEGGPRIVVDELKVSVLYAADDAGPFVLAAIDYCDIEYEILDLLMKPIVTAFKVPPERIVFMPSHGHVSVVYDTEKLEEQIYSAVKQAVENQKETEIAFLNIPIDGKKYIINRRLFVPGLGTKTIMFNDHCIVKDDCLDATTQISQWIKNLGANPSDFRPPNKWFFTQHNVDNSLQAVFFRDQKSKALCGSFVRFAAHAVIVSEKKVRGDISADYPGYLKNRMQKILGGVAMFAQGFSGDLRPLHKEYSHDCAREYGQHLADLIIAQFSNLEWKSVNNVSFVSKPISFPLLQNIPQTNTEAKKELDRIETLYDQAVNPEEKRKLQNEFWFYYRCEDVLKILRPEWIRSRIVKSRVFAAVFDNNVILMCPGEQFSSTHLKISEKFLDRNIMILGNVNEYISYMPPKDEIEKGGYEPSVCLVASDSSEKLLKTACEILNGL